MKKSLAAAFFLTAGPLVDAFGGGSGPLTSSSGLPRNIASTPMTASDRIDPPLSPRSSRLYFRAGDSSGDSDRFRGLALHSPLFASANPASSPEEDREQPITAARALIAALIGACNHLCGSSNARVLLGSAWNSALGACKVVTDLVAVATDFGSSAETEAAALPVPTEDAESPKKNKKKKELDLDEMYKEVARALVEETWNRGGETKGKFAEFDFEFEFSEFGSNKRGCNLVLLPSFETEHNSSIGVIHGTAVAALFLSVLTGATPFVAVGVSIATAYVATTPGFGGDVLRAFGSEVETICRPIALAVSNVVNAFFRDVSRTKMYALPESS